MHRLYKNDMVYIGDSPHAKAAFVAMTEMNTFKMRANMLRQCGIMVVIARILKVLISRGRI